jgi:uncharacterized membrane protein
MVQQHLGAWMWNQPWRDIRALLAEHPFMIGLNGLGGLAAPLFVVLAGMGASFLVVSKENPDRILVGRGLALMALGYALNLAVPGWFTAGSWYILHLIGFSYVAAPLLRRLPARWLFAVMAAGILSAVALQTILDTPYFIRNARMGDLSLAGGHLRLAFVEGHFPVFPWLSVFVAGMAAGRALLAGRPRNVVVLAVGLAGTGGLLALAGNAIPSLTQVGPVKRFFVMRTGFYPALPPVTLLLSAVALLCTAAAWKVGQLARIYAGNPLVCLGRASLTVFVSHIIIFRELAQRLGLSKACSKPGTMVLIAGVAGAAAALAMLWRGAGYRFGAEWLVRKAGEFAPPTWSANRSRP